MKLRTLFILGALIFLGGAFAVRYLPYFQEPVDSIELPLLEVDPSAVFTLSIMKENEELLISKADDVWIASNGQWSNPLDLGQVNQLLQPLQKAYSKGVASQIKADWDRYSITDEAATLVRLYDQNQVLQSFYLSRVRESDSTNVMRYYLRLPDLQLVYEVEADFATPFLLPFSSYRPKSVLDFDPEAVQALHFSYPDSTRVEWSRQDTIWVDTNGNGILHQELAPWIGKLSTLKGERFADAFDEIQAEKYLERKISFFVENKGEINLFLYSDSLRFKGAYILRSDQYPESFFTVDTNTVKAPIR